MERNHLIVNHKSQNLGGHCRIKKIFFIPSHQSFDHYLTNC